MSFKRVLVAIGVFLSLSVGCVEFDSVPPRVMAFTASPTQLRVGDAVVVEWRALGAESMTLVDHLGVPLEMAAAIGTAEAGQVVVHPVKDTTYLLEVTGSGGTDLARVSVYVYAEEK